ncbi:hypothetical protein [Larkinella rosea]|uniref:Uncharacterized protein n=1 Tax=Larkinella rosea TaxID=2025312 RepID=A0A3P1BGL1_9BACT|nr:hypothetical protein [Larkinella rosea]RRB00122.1 hypothetical protein EHT25_26220 [Larkinella rosea]
MKSLFTFRIPTGISAISVLSLLLLFACNFPNGSGEPVYQGSYQEASAFSAQFAGLLMNQYYPNTGREFRARTNDWSYDPDTQRYTIDMTSTWMGRGCWICDECQVEARGYLYVNRDGTNPQYQMERVNDCALGHDLQGLMIGTLINVAADELSKGN